VAVGEIGFDDQTEAEAEYLRKQLELAMRAELPVLVHTPHRDKKQGTIRTIEIVREVGIPETMVLIDHNTEETLPIVLETDCWAGHSIYPHTKMNEERMARLVERYGSEKILINSAADWGISDPLKVVKTVDAMKAAGIALETIQKIVWDNPLTFFGQSGKLNREVLEKGPATPEGDLFEGSTIKRGER